MDQSIHIFSSLDSERPPSSAASSVGRPQSRRFIATDAVIGDAHPVEGLKRRDFTTNSFLVHGTTAAPATPFVRKFKLI